MTIKDTELIEHGCRVAEAIGIVGPANIQCFREPDGGLPVTDVNPRFGGGFRCRPRPGAAIRSWRSRSRTGERPEPRIGEFREGVFMTRFFSHLSLTEDGDGPLVPFAEELPEPIWRLISIIGGGVSCCSEGGG